MLTGSDLSESDLFNANLENAGLGGCDFRGAYLGYATFNRDTHLFRTDLEYAAFKGNDARELKLDHDTQWPKTFGDASVLLPKRLQAGVAPLEHWPTEHLNPTEFTRLWRAWQKDNGYTPPD